MGRMRSRLQEREQELERVQGGFQQQINALEADLAKAREHADAQREEHRQQLEAAQSAAVTSPSEDDSEQLDDLRIELESVAGEREQLRSHWIGHGRGDQRSYCPSRCRSRRSPDSAGRRCTTEFAHS